MRAAVSPGSLSVRSSVGCAAPTALSPMILHSDVNPGFWCDCECLRAFEVSTIEIGAFKLEEFVQQCANVSQWQCGNVPSIYIVQK